MNITSFACQWIPSHLWSPFSEKLTDQHLSNIDKVTSVAMASIPFAAQRIGAPESGLQIPIVLSAAYLFYFTSASLKVLHARPYLAALRVLLDAGLLKPNNGKAAVLHHSPEALALALAELQKAGLLNQENYQGLVHYKIPITLSDGLDFISLYLALDHLNQYGLLTQENFQCLLWQEKPYQYAVTLIETNAITIEMQHDQ